MLEYEIDEEQQRWTTILVTPNLIFPFIIRWRNLEIQKVLGVMLENIKG